MSIEERVHRLERENRICRLCIAVVVIATAVAWGTSDGTSSQAMAQAKVPVAEKIRARQLEIVDDIGQAMITMSASNAGPVLRLAMPGETDAITIMMTEGKPRMAMAGKAGSVEITENNVSVLRADAVKKHERERIVKALKAGKTISDADRATFLATSRDEPVVEIARSEANGGLINIYNALGTIVATFQSTKANAGVVVVGDLNGKPTGALP